jgi:putative intracellular protease/amidase
MHSRIPGASLIAALVLPVAAARSADDPPALRELPTMRVGVVVHEGVEVLDFAGPAEVFDAAGKTLRVDERSWFEVVTVAPGGGTVAAHGGVLVEPRSTIDDCAPLDVLVIPGGATQVLQRDPAFMEWVRRTAPQTRAVLSVCTGAYVLADAGLLDGRSATTHHNAVRGLREAAKQTEVLAGRRVVDGWPIVTSAGVASGIDGALHVVARLVGRRIADATAEYMEHRWEPEPQLVGTYSDGSPLLDDWGRARQEIQHLRGRGDWKGVAALANELIALAPEDGTGWYELGLALHQQGELDEAIAAHEAATEDPVRAAAAHYNLSCAWARKGERENAFAALARAVDAGWMRRGTTERDSDLTPLRDDARFAALLARIGEPAPIGQPAWAASLLERGREHVRAGRIDVGLRLLLDGADGAPEAARAELQSTLARPDAVPSDYSWRARRLLAAHPWPGSIELAPRDEPGERIVIAGTVRDPGGRALAGAKLHVFQADAAGCYRPEHAMDERNARLNGWVAADASGRFEIGTIRPGCYPQPREDATGDARFIPAHVHFEIEAPGRECRRFQLVFADDPRMTPHWREWARLEQNPMIELVRGEDGVLRGTLEICLR